MAAAPASGRYQSLVPEDGAGIEVFLQQVADDKHGKNRLHLDLRTGDLAAEVRRMLEQLCASLLTGQPVIEDCCRWSILTDVHGIEFCLLPSPERRLARAAPRTIAFPRTHSP